MKKKEEKSTYKLSEWIKDYLADKYLIEYECKYEDLDYTTQKNVCQEIFPSLCLRLHYILSIDIHDRGKINKKYFDPFNLYTNEISQITKEDNSSANELEFRKKFKEITKLETLFFRYVLDNIPNPKVDKTLSAIKNNEWEVLSETVRNNLFIIIEALSKHPRWEFCEEMLPYIKFKLKQPRLYRLQLYLQGVYDCKDCLEKDELYKTDKYKNLYEKIEIKLNTVENALKGIYPECKKSMEEIIDSYELNIVDFCPEAFKDIDI